jgi:hypothetical protein
MYFSSCSSMLAITLSFHHMRERHLGKASCALRKPPCRLGPRSGQGAPGATNSLSFRDKAVRTP